MVTRASPYCSGCPGRGKCFGFFNSSKMGGACSANTFIVLVNTRVKPSLPVQRTRCSRRRNPSRKSSFPCPLPSFLAADELILMQSALAFWWMHACASSVVSPETLPWLLACIGSGDVMSLLVLFYV